MQIHPPKKQKSVQSVFSIAGWITFIISVYGTVRIIWFACKSDDTNRYCGFQRLASFVGFSYWLQFFRILGNKSGSFCEAVNCEQSEQEGKFLFATLWFQCLVSSPGSIRALGNKSGSFCEAVNCEQSEQEGKFPFATLWFPASGIYGFPDNFSQKLGTFRALGNKSGSFCEAVNCEQSEQEGKFPFATFMVSKCWSTPTKSTRCNPRLGYV